MHTPPPAANRMPYPLMFEDQIPELLAALPQRISDTVAVWAERSQIILPWLNRAVRGRIFSLRTRSPKPGTGFSIWGCAPVTVS